MAAAEAAIDFADEADVAGDFEAEVVRNAAKLDRAIGSELEKARFAARVRDGVVVVLMGPPNAGKSTLLNALARRDVAIVSAHAGTTRDPIEVQLDLDGRLVICFDTAGLRDTNDPIEHEAIARAQTRADSADLVLWLSDARFPVEPAPALGERQTWTVATHVDLAVANTRADFQIAVPTGAGVAELIGALRGFVDRDQGGGAGLVTRLRHRRALEHARSALAPLISGRGLPGPELLAEQLRAVGDGFDALVGRIGADEVLGEIFSRFCVGK